MFENLSSRLQQTIKSMTGRGRLTDSNIQEALREVRVALLEADVALPVVKQFIEKVRDEAMGTKVLGSLTPGQAFIKVVHDALIKTMGEATAPLNLKAAPPAVILMSGLQGSGKTTTVAKLANLLQTREHKKVLVVSADVYRPAAIEQLATLAQSINVAFCPSEAKEDPIKIALRAIDQAKKQFMDVVIIDTAGRLHVDQTMMDEIKKIHAAANPVETLFVVDSMTGQDAVNTAKAFHETIPLTGVVLTKTDGDARGGAALSVWETIHQPIKFIGTGEKTDAFEPFHPDRIVSRLLGMGDIVSLAEEVHLKMDQEKAAKMAKKIAKGKGFDLEDFLEQIEQMNNMGGMTALLSKLPGMGQLPTAVKGQLDDSLFTRMKVMIQSMTIRERRFPHLIRHSHKLRITKGSGTTVPDLNRLLKQFEQMQKMMKKFSQGGGMMKMMRQLGSIKGMLGGGSLPPDMPSF